MAEFVYNNTKNDSIGHTPFELNCGYHSCVSFKEDTDLCSRSKTVDELSAKLQELMTVCRENLHHAQKLQKNLTIKASSLGARLLVTKFS